jgi:probable rRNA maturation factor
MERPGVSVEVQGSGDLPLPVAADRVEQAVRLALREEAITEATVSVTFLSDAEISAMNREYLEHAGPTDVISFRLSIPGGTPVGDVYIGAEQAERQAAELGVPLDQELLRLAIHGTLHVLGFEHPEGDDRLDSSMYRRQEELLEKALRAEAASG